MELFELDKKDFVKVKSALNEDDAALKAVLDEYHSSEIAILFNKLSKEHQERIINLSSVEQASEIIAEMDEEAHPENLLLQLQPEKRTEIVEELDVDDAVDIISQLNDQDQQEILENLDKADAKAIRNLLSYPEDTAGGIMNTQIIKVYIDDSKKSAIDEIVRQSEEMEDFYAIYVVDRKEVFQGLVSLKNLIKSKINDTIATLVETDVVYVHPQTDQEDVAKLISQYNLTSLPVVDDEMKLLGRITFDDVIDVLQEENTEDILKISGVSEDEELSGNWKDAVKSRLPWLFVNLGTAFLAASVIRYFDSTVERIPILSAYMTIIAGMGGNAATQSLAVTVRRISLNDLSDKQAYNTIVKEFIVGLVNGASNGVVVFFVAYFLDLNLMLGLVVFLAMTGNLVVAAVTGTSIPLFLKRIGVDPAIASSIIITTFTDVLGFLLILGLASKLLL